MNEERVKRILDLLSDEYVKSDWIAARIGVSSKTIRNEIKECSAVLEKHGAIIEKKPKKGIRLQIRDAKAYQSYLQSMTLSSVIPSTFEQRVTYLLEYLLNTSDWVKAEDLCDQLYVSPSNLSNCLKEVRKRLNNYNIRLISKPGYGLKIQGNEFDIRLCMTHASSEPGDILWVQEDDSEDALLGKQMLRKISDVLNQCFYRYEYHMSDISFHNLIIHIYIAMHRIENGQEAKLSDSQFEEIQTWNEYELAREIVKTLGKKFNISFASDEIGYIAIHLAAKKIVSLDDTANGNVVIHPEVYEMVTHMLQAVYNAYKIDLMDDLDLRMMLALHLLPFGVRMDYDIVLRNPLLKDIKTKYTLAYNLAVVASDELCKHYNKRIKEDEIGYFALHFNLALERKNKKNDKKNILIVCGTGRGTAQLLLYQFKENFGKYLNKIITCDALSIPKQNFENIDYVITTVPIHTAVPVPILEIQTFVEEKDVKNIHKFLLQHSSVMEKYFQKDLFLTHIQLDTKEEVLRYMVNQIHNVYPNLPYDFYDAVIRRENQAVTEFGNLVAIPHPYKAMTENTFVCVCILDKPILWDKKKVQLVYLMSMENNPNRNLMTFYKITSKLLVNSTYVHELIQKKDFHVLISLFEGIERELEEL